MSAFSWANTALGQCRKKAHATGGHHADYAVDGSARERLEQAKLEKHTSAMKINHAVPRDKAPMPVGPQRPEPDGSPSTKMIPKRKARSPMTRPRFAKLHDAEAEGSAVMAELKTHTDKYSAEDVKQALERSQEEIS